MCEVILEAKIENLANVQIDKQEYAKPGVWALYGRKLNEEWKCLEVGKTIDVCDEVECAIFILTTPEKSEECINCSRKKYPARQRFKEKSAKFQIHSCKGCQHTSELRTKTRKRNPRYIDKYKDMLEEGYIYFKFVCVNITDEMRDDKTRRKVEQEYAEKHTALYWCG